MDVVLHGLETAEGGSGRGPRGLVRPGLVHGETASEVEVTHDRHSHFFDSPTAAREWLDQNFQGTRSDQQYEFASQKLNRQTRRVRRKQDSTNSGRGGPSP
ncbi:hypothetical protein NDU88_001445 [Pleurodeles waltl]|uniref:Uncharacterized protein n=1 Tax=Pleurodeles waltl TaxID=8319 RepID=A0AAV7UTD0_PLEWA|nr:hypothetical protein NDU88_001445 [Pleurodeles waltl]